MGISVNSQEQWPQDLQDQLNGQTGHYGIANGKLPGGVTPGSLASYQDENALTFHIADNSRNFTAGVRIPKTLTFFTGITRSTAAPTTTELPAAGNFGWHQNTSTGAYYWAYNDAGSVVFPSFASVTGTITGDQHGDLSAFVGILHDFTQIQGVITGTQHGTHSGAGTFHSFLGITGVITDAQHGSRGNISGTAHDLVTAAEHGFARKADYSKLLLYPPDCTTVHNDSNAVQRSAGTINADRYAVNGTQVVGARDTSWALSGAYTPRSNLNGAANTLSTATLADYFYTLVQSLMTHGLIG